MANKARGESGLRIGGKTLPVAFDMGALAAIEAEFDTNSFEDVLAELSGAEKMSAARLLRLMAAVFRERGHDEYIPMLNRMMPADLNALALDLLTGAFPDPDTKKKGKTANP